MHFKFELWRWCMWPLVAYADVKDVSSVNAVAVIIAMTNIIGAVDVMYMYLDEKRKYPKLAGYGNGGFKSISG